MLVTPFEQRRRAGEAACAGAPDLNRREHAFTLHAAARHEHTPVGDERRRVRGAGDAHRAGRDEALDGRVVQLSAAEGATASAASDDEDASVLQLRDGEATTG